MFEGLERITFSKDWITIVLMLILIIISIIKLYYNDRFVKLFSLIYSEKYYTNYIKTKPLIFNTFHLLFLFIIIFNISLFLFFLLKAFLPSKTTYDYFYFFEILFILITYFIIRFSIGHFLGIIFGVSDEQKQVTLFKISNLSLLSVYLFPVLIIIHYNSTFRYKYLITFSVIVMGILFLFRYFVMLKNTIQNFNSFFYLILYLCALEIAPFIVIYKMFVD